MHSFPPYGAAKAGDVFAYREKASALGQQVKPVEFVREGPPRSAKARIRWLDGEYQGLEQWVPRVRLLCDWKDVDALLSDERNLEAAVDAAGAPERTLAYKAAEAVFTAVSPDERVMFGWRAQERALIRMEDPERAAEEFGLTVRALLQQPLAFIDRFGVYRAPFDAGEWLAQYFCTTRPERVLRALDAEERALREAVISHYYVAPPPSTFEYEMTTERAEEQLSEHLQLSGLIRRWCGETAVSHFDEMQAVKDEVERLRNVIKAAGQWLLSSGQEYRGRSLLREIGIVDQTRRAQRKRRSNP
jgi:hypothetical protein